MPGLTNPAGVLQARIGDGGLMFSGSARSRYETINGQVRPGFSASEDLVSLRTIIGAEAVAGRVRFGAEVWDSRLYAANAGSAVSTNEVNALEVVQAYARLDLGHTLGRGSSTSVQMGRFIAALGSRRLIAADEYRNTTNAFTGVRADARLRGGTTATFLYALPNQRLPADLSSILANEVEGDRVGFDLVLWGGVISRPHSIGRAMIESSYFRLAEHDEPGRPTRDRHLHTVSVRLFQDPAAGIFDWEGEAIYQFGTISSTASANAPMQDVSATFFHAGAGYTFPGRLKARVAVLYDRASGDGAGPTYGRFDTLLGMRRAELAPAGLYNAIGRANIGTPGVRMEIAPGRFDAFAAYRVLWAADARDSFSTTGVRDPTGASGSFAGHQLEGRVRYWLVPRLIRLEANAVWLIRGRLLEAAPNATSSGDTLYTSLQIATQF